MLRNWQGLFSLGWQVCIEQLCMMRVVIKVGALWLTIYQVLQRAWKILSDLLFLSKIYQSKKWRKNLCIFRKIIYFYWEHLTLFLYFNYMLNPVHQTIAHISTRKLCIDTHISQAVTYFPCLANQKRFVEYHMFYTLKRTCPAFVMGPGRNEEARALCPVSRNKIQSHNSVTFTQHSWYIISFNEQKKMHQFRKRRSHPPPTAF